MIKPTFNHKCYKTKDDKRHETIVSRPCDVSKERWESIFGSEEERKKRLREWKENRSNLTENSKIDVNAPMVSKWSDEWTYLATGRRMSKRELKRYCKDKGKEWINS